MKRLLLVAFTAFGLAGLPCLAPAGPLQKSQVPADAKWVLHLDLEAALNSELGRFLAKEVDRRLRRPLADLKSNHGLEVDWRKLQSLTVFGTEFGSRPDEDGVVLVRTSLNLPGLLDKIAEDGASNGSLTREKKGERVQYSLNEEVHGAAGGNGVFVLSKSLARLDQALAVVEGKGANLGASKTFSRLPAAPDGFIFLGLAEGFSTSAAVPPQAKMLRQSDGGQLVAGEKAGQIFATLNLSTKDAEAAGQIHQVLQGLLALAAMNQTENKDLQRLVQATKVSTNNTLVNVNLELPASNIISRISKELRKREE